MSYTKEELTEKITERIGELLNESIKNYMDGKKKAAWNIVDYNPDTGRIMLVLWPNDNVINICWSPYSAGVGDLGTPIGAVSTEYFGIETIASLLATIVMAFTEE